MTDKLAIQKVFTEEINEAIQEAKLLYDVWDTARDINTEYYYVTVQRSAMKRLRELIGPQAYYAGVLPAHVPIWRFQKVQ